MVNLLIQIKSVATLSHFLRNMANHLTYTVQNSKLFHLLSDVNITLACTCAHALIQSLKQHDFPKNLASKTAIFVRHLKTADNAFPLV